ncbi:hypothetical protein T440DRAFT_557283 [Plenodomus tracheiphilus IPT5]|uniref:Uncharacterized protein n=1 Tax=Plenodomus tracheiphilus IPT5 TaxID=1408161 RepID=A0A6A7AWE4_9PLEO|nr:hypothetical protein T440DRAFT_557283 [Plenodomus tracheiphilus IPT5]
MPPTQSPNGHAPPSSPRNPSATKRYQKSSSPLPVSPGTLRNNLDHILDDLTSSPSTSSISQSLSSPLPSSLLDNRNIIAGDDGSVDVSSEDGNEDEVRLDEEQFEFGNETSDGYEDEDKSMTSSDEEEEEEREEDSGGNGERDNETSGSTDRAATTPAEVVFSDVYVHHQPTGILTEKNREKPSVDGDTIEDVLNTPYMTGRTFSSQYPSSSYVGNMLVPIPVDEQIRRDKLRAQINAELSRRWEYQRQHSQAAAEEDRYDSSGATEWEVLEDGQDGLGGPEKSDADTEDADVELKNSNICLNGHSHEGSNSNLTTSTISTTPAPRSGKENTPSLSLLKRRRKASSPVHPAKMAQEDLLNDLNPEEQAELEELEKYRDDNLAPLDGSGAYPDGCGDTAERGTPVKDAYKLYLSEQSEGTSEDDRSVEVESEKGEEGEEHDKEVSATNTFFGVNANLAISSAISSPDMVTRSLPSRSISREVVQGSDKESDDSDAHESPVGQCVPLKNHQTLSTILGVIMVVMLGLFVALYVQLANLAVIQGQDRVVRLEL